MCRATQKAACRVPVTCRCVTGVRPHTRHAPRGPESGAREQSAAVPPPPGPAPALASTSGPAQRGAALLCPTATVRAYSERPAPGRRRGRESARGGAGRGGQGRPTRTALGIPTVAIRHTATQALSGGPATPGPAASPPVRGPSPSRAARAGRPPRFKVFSYPRCQNPRGTRTRPPPHTGTAQTASIILHMLIFSPPVTTRGRAQPGCPSL